MPKISAIYRYPVKGFTGERLEQVALTPNQTLPFDRAYAIENGTRDFDPDAPAHFAKTKFLMLARHERLASLETRFDDETQSFVVSRDGRQVASGNLAIPVGRKLIEQFIAAYLKDELRGPPHLVGAPGHSFSDVPDKWVSIINLNSVKDIERVIGKPVDPLRFRANLYVDGLPAWAEFDWVGQAIAVGDSAALQVLERTGRCAAINVNPATAERDMQLPKSLMSAFGHAACGVYARVNAGGQITTGDAVSSRRLG